MPGRAPEDAIESYEAKLDVHGPEPAFNEDGVDLTLIRSTLDMTSVERLQYAERCAREIEQTRARNGIQMLAT